MNAKETESYAKEQAIINILSRTERDLKSILSERSGIELPPIRQRLDNVQALLECIEETINEFDEHFRHLDDATLKIIAMNERHLELNHQLLGGLRRSAILDSSKLVK